ncbi:MAG: hypothetical protein JKY22_04370 [Flavobacteriaceae bacterium]|nr:hypothetical protein [Flavobacteriaceae bacterium]
MKYLKPSFVLIALMLFSCNSKKTTADAMAESKKVEMHTKMTSNGYKMGTIIASKEEGDCPFVIQMEGEDQPYFLDPINLDESFKKNGEKIWFTFGPLRMMNRCEKANPVSIIEIEKREE